MNSREFDRNMHSEQWVIGAVLLVPNGFDIVAPIGLTKDSFAYGQHGAMWLGIERCASKGIAIDPLTVYEQLRSIGQGDVSLEYMVNLATTTYGINGLKQHAERVKQRELERGMKNAGLTIAGFAEDQEQSVSEKMEKAQNLISAVGRTAIRSAPRLVAEIALEQTARWDEMQAGKITAGWPTHIPAIDSAMNGGMRPGQLIILAARPGVGKSSFSQQIALGHASDGRSTLFLSQEMPSSELSDRACANIGRIDYGAIQSGQMTPEHWYRASEALDKLAGLPYSIDDQPALTLMDIRTKARMVPGVKVIFVDYLQLCVGEGDNRTAQIGAISRGLKGLAKEMGICVVALSQLNRKVEERPGKRPTLSDLRDSGEIEQDADVIWFLWPVKDLPDGRKLIGFEQAKNRQGKLMQVGLDFYGAHQRWGQSTMDIFVSEAPAVKRKGGFDE